MTTSEWLRRRDLRRNAGKAVSAVRKWGPMLYTFARGAWSFYNGSGPGD
ncbi:hypothetical protein [Streptomyces sp. SID3343]|nr:hypothetical protein [Streptomyces sp. SID3343]MYW03308.1 hypothetical protein [Streptomyces sp. SID3343]